MGVNVVAVVATVLAVTAGVFGALLLTTTEFVEVFVQDGPKEDDLSCRIGFLGVYEAGFDAGCLTDDALQGSGLGAISPLTGERTLNVDAFESDTLDFKLLFVAQSEFYSEVNPLNSFGVSNPEFEDCEQYLDALKDQPQQYADASPLVNGLLFGSFVNAVTNEVFTNYFDNATTNVSTLVGGLAQFLDGTADAFTGSNGALITDAATYFGTMQTTATGFGLTNIATVAGNAAALGGTIDGLTLVAVPSGLILQALFSGAGDLSVTSGLAVPDEFSALFCGIFGEAPSCTMTDMVALISAVGTDIANANADTAGVNVTANSLRDGWNGVGLIVTTLGVASNPICPLCSATTAATSALTADNTADVGKFTTLAMVPADVASAFPATFDATNNFPPCQLLRFANQLTDVIATFGGDANFDASGGCSFKNFLLPDQSAFDDAGTVTGFNLAANLANVAAPELLSSVEGFAGLFQTCATAGLLPNSCYGFFPTVILATAYQDQELATKFPNAFEAAKEKCSDDEKDSEAISSAQVMGPAGVSLVFVSAIAGIISLVKPVKAVSAVAALLALVGAGLVLAALVGVQQAPVYDNVGAETEQFDVVYVSGITAIYGLLCVSLGAVASVGYIVSIFVCRGSDENVLDGDLKPASL